MNYELAEQGAYVHKKTERQITDLIDVSLSSQDNEIEEKIEEQLLSSQQVSWVYDIQNLVLLFFLYLYQGLIIRFFANYTPTILIKRGISNSEIANLESTTLPFSLKFLFAPFQDSYYSPQFGKRQSYIVPCQYLILCMIGICALTMNEFIEQQSVLSIFLISLSLIWLVSLQDIAVNGWSVQLLHPGNVSYGSICQSMGKSLGGLLIFNLMVWVNKDAINDNTGRTPFIIDSEFLATIIFFLVLAGTLYVHLIQKEKNEEEVQSAEGETSRIRVVQTVKKIKFFWKNKNLRYLVFFLLIQRVGSSMVEDTSTAILLRNGFPVQTLTTISLCMTPLEFIASFLAGFFSKKKKQFSLYLVCLVYSTISMVLNYYIVQTFLLTVQENQFGVKYGDVDSVFFPLVIVYCFDAISSYSIFVGISSFFLRICDQKFGGMYLTFLYSFSNFGKLWSRWLAFQFLSTLGFFWLFVLGVIFNFIHFVFWRMKLMKFQASDQDQWKFGD